MQQLPGEIVRNNGYMKTEEQIISAFFQLLDEKTFEEITATEIIVRAGINRSTFYRHYQDKYEILEHFQQQAQPITRMLVASYMREDQSLFHVLFNTDYLEKHFPQEYKKAFLKLLKIHTPGFDITTMIHQGFAEAYVPQQTARNPELEKELFADLAVKMLIYKIDDTKSFAGDGMETIASLYGTLKRMD